MRLPVAGSLYRILPFSLGPVRSGLAHAAASKAVSRTADLAFFLGPGLPGHGPAD